MIEKYEQMELDTRTEFVRATEGLAKEAVATVQGMVARCQEYSHSPVRNRHEAYGIAAEQLCRIVAAEKIIKRDVETLLGTLGNPNADALDAVASIVNSATAAVTVQMVAAAEMKRAMEDLYSVEAGTGDNAPTPLEELAAGADFEEAPADEDAADAENGADE